MSAVVPPSLVGVKALFTGVEDPETHLTTFHTQMMLSGGSDAVYCKLFMSTLSEIALEWFVSLPDGHITSFQQFSKLFMEQYIVNRAPQWCRMTCSTCVKTKVSPFGTTSVVLELRW